MNSKQRRTLTAIFADPINGNIEWRAIESLLLALGCEIIEGSGSRATFLLNGQRVDLHRPHPQKEALRYRVKDVRLFLQRAGVQDE
ncbi:MAG: type II toxin-antitoxin system HicA family toxin [Caldilineaceae bacterium]|nr:type II toxin-antitoxin system HicA family toxin [Caldilineaceae bacterium]